LEDFVAEAFTVLKLNWRDHVAFDSSLIRPSEIQFSRGNPDKAARILKWNARYKMRDVVRIMVEADLKLAKGDTLIT